MTLAVLLAALAGACAAAAIVEVAGARAAAGRGSAPGRLGASAAPPGHLAGMTILLARLARRVGVRPPPAELQARIAAAGSPLGLTAADVMALKAVGALTGVLVAITMLGALPGRLGIAAFLIVPAAGFLAPDLALARRRRARAALMLYELPDLLDLLRVAIQAGLPVGRALAEVGARCNGQLAAEFEAAATRLQLGATRAAAFAELVARCPIDGVATLTAAIARAERHGAPLGPALESLVAESRAEQARRLRDEAARAAPKIQLVVALVLVPAVMLLIGAVLVQTLG